MFPLVRFAPSPTGLLHMGNARIAILNWIFARRHKGRFLLRMDDTDRERSRDEYEKQILRDMDWLGLDYDLFERQSARKSFYQAAEEQLKKQGRLYPCYETEEELSLKRKVMLGRHVAPIYDRTALSLSTEQIQDFEAKGRKPHWRFMLKDETIIWSDLSRGALSFEAVHLSDPVLVREDGRPLYTLSSVVDDGMLGVTHVLRGADHISNTAIQIQLFKALGYDVPHFCHLSLLSDEQGQGLSKRLGSLSLSKMAEQGFQPHALLSYLTLLGTNQTATGTEKIEQLIKAFDLSLYGRANPSFSLKALEDVNSRVLQRISFEAIAPLLKDKGLEKADKLFWETMRDNIRHFDDLKRWYQLCYHQIKPDIAEDDRDYLDKAADLLTEIKSRSDYQEWIKQLADFSKRKGKVLYMPLRKALTSENQGPELDSLLMILGVEKASERLRGKTA